jgi:hypothetical protein
MGYQRRGAAESCVLSHAGARGWSDGGTCSGVDVPKVNLRSILKAPGSEAKQ